MVTKAEKALIRKAKAGPRPVGLDVSSDLQACMTMLERVTDGYDRFRRSYTSQRSEAVIAARLLLRRLRETHNG